MAPSLLAGEVGRKDDFGYFLPRGGSSCREDDEPLFREALPVALDEAYPVDADGVQAPAEDDRIVVRDFPDPDLPDLADVGAQGLRDPFRVLLRVARDRLVDDNDSHWHIKSQFRHRRITGKAKPAGRGEYIADRVLVYGFDAIGYRVGSGVRWVGALSIAPAKRGKTMNIPNFIS